MRLIHTDTLGFFEVQNESAVEYAIVSHRWEEEEISYQELGSLQAARHSGPETVVETVKSKKGFAKLESAARIAREQGFQYVWIDTCCIDKSSSAELSEAINSMYRWYQSAAVCYAYLSDVEYATDFLDSASDQLGQSKWFSRGWTLQELIAPSNTIFYASNWLAIGEKDNLKMRGLLSTITGIDDRLLRNELDPGDFSVAVRMRWAATRITTRIEDIAYCLMGLFDVNMPLLYGEGKKAFIRLQEEILKTTDDQSIFAWKTPASDDDGEDPSQMCGLLAESPEYFRDTLNYRPLPPLESQGSVPWSVTNQGLRAQLFLRHSHSSSGEAYFEAVLECSVRHNYADSSPSIVLQKLWGDQYARVKASSCGPVKTPNFDMSQAQLGGSYEMIFVKQNPTFVLPEFTVSPGNRYKPVDPEEEYFMLEEVFPLKFWDSHSMSLKVPYNCVNRPVALLRFINNRFRLSPPVDVAVGLIKDPSGRGWKNWFHQLPCLTDSKLADLLEEIKDIELPSNAESCRGALEDDLNKIFRNAPWAKTSQQSSPATSSSGDNLQHEPIAVTSVEETRKHGRLYYAINVSLRPEMPGVTPSNIGSPNGAPVANVDAAIRLELEESILPLIADVFEAEDFQWRWIFSGVGLDSDRIRKTSDIGQLKKYLSKTVVPVAMESELSLACRTGDAERVSGAIRRTGPNKIDVNESTQFRHIQYIYSFSPLHWAALFGYKSIVYKLIQAGASIMAQTSQGWTAAHLAAITGEVEVVSTILGLAKLQKLTKYEILCHSKAPNGDTPLHVAAGMGAPQAKDRNERIVETWRDMTFSEDELQIIHWRTWNDRGETPLHRAAATGNWPFLQMITLQEPYLSVERTSAAESQLLPFQDVDDKGRSVLWHAACGGTGDMIRRLVESGALIDLADNDGLTPLHVACRVGNRGAVAELLRLGASPDARSSGPGLTAAHFAALFGHADCVEELAARGVPVDDDTDTRWVSFRPIHLAVANGHFDCFQALYKAGADFQRRSTHHISLSRDGQLSGYHLVELYSDCAGVARFQQGKGPAGNKFKYQRSLAAILEMEMGISSPEEDSDDDREDYFDPGDVDLMSPVV